MKHKIFVDFPKSGLGNLLLIWARAKIFSYLNGIPLIASSWWSIRWGSWLRLENKKRVYWGYFKESPLLQRLQLPLLKKTFSVVKEPAVAKATLPAQSTLFIFSTTVVENDLFSSIRPFRDIVKQELFHLLTTKLLEQLEKLKPPVVSIHIRRGDFKISNPITPTQFFISGICYIRQQTGKELAVTVFTDASKEEISDILAMKNVVLADKNPDILDLLQMSRSRILFLSQSSTFSYWAAFLSNAIVIKPQGDWQNDLRPAEVNQLHFEGKVNFNDLNSLASLSKALQNEIW